VAMIQ